jgi:Mn2+/Fe2+ NRAMP family transporter
MKFNKLLKLLGPGLLWAGAAIGVSHLVQSTRAGALFGFGLIVPILVINLIKYPFFEFAPRYAASAKESLLEGYNRLGKWAITLYFVLTISTMFTIQAAITSVTAGILTSIIGHNIDIFVWFVLILVAGSAIVLRGRYSLLDKTVKFIIVILAVTTIVAVVATLINKGIPVTQGKVFTWEFSDIAILIAFAGWMPSAIDVSVWHSVWSVAKMKETKRDISVKESLIDFNIGYICTVVLSIGFLALGAMIMYGSGQTFSANGATFADQLINLFTSSLGSWAYPVIAVAALATMVSTTLTCLDAYPRVLVPTTALLTNRKSITQNRWSPIIWLIILVIGTIIVNRFFINNMKLMVDVATTISFITAPVLGWLNYRVVTGKNVPKQDQPKRWLRILTWLGIVVLVAFSIYYIIWRFFIPVA